MQRLSQVPGFLLHCVTKNWHLILKVTPSGYKLNLQTVNVSNIEWVQCSCWMIFRRIRLFHDVWCSVGSLKSVWYLLRWSCSCIEQIWQAALSITKLNSLMHHHRAAPPTKQQPIVILSSHHLSFLHVFFNLKQIFVSGTKMKKHKTISDFETEHSLLKTYLRVYLWLQLITSVSNSHCSLNISPW